MVAGTTVAQSLEEYVKAAMLIEMLKARGLGAGLERNRVRHERRLRPRRRQVGQDSRLPRLACSTRRALVDKLRAQIPGAQRKFRDLPFPTRISDTLTLSTFHGCPPGEIEAIVEHLIGEFGLDVVVKLNPTLLGREEVDAILRDKLGYSEIRVPDTPSPRTRTGTTSSAWSSVSAPMQRRAAGASG